MSNTPRQYKHEHLGATLTHPQVDSTTYTPRVYDVYFFFQAEDGMRDLVRSRGLGDVYKRQLQRHHPQERAMSAATRSVTDLRELAREGAALVGNCLLYTSDAADERSSVDLGGRRIIKQQKLLR